MSQQNTPFPKLLDEILNAFSTQTDSKSVTLVWGTKDQIEEAKHQLLTAIEQLGLEVIGQDEKHYNGQKMVNDPSECMDCTNPDERFCRNQHRAEQRAALKKALTEGE